MKTTKESFPEKSFPRKNHSILKKLSAILLCICLLFVSFPSESYGSEAPQKNAQQNISSFLPLPAEISQQTVPSGTPLEHLNLPLTLAAVCTLAEHTDPQEPITLTSITWTSEPAYDSQTPGTYVFTPVLPENYSLAEGLSLPSISVHVQEPSPADSNGPEGAEGSYVQNVPENDSDSHKQNVIQDPEDNNQLPDMRDHSLTIIDPEESKEQNQNSDPLKKDPAEKIIESEILAADQSLSETPDNTDLPCTIIDSDQVCHATLENEKLIINPGVTLTIDTVIEIKGEVIIEGGGTILRTRSKAGFHSKSNGKLTLRGVTVDGNSSPAEQPMINLYDNSQIILDHCTIKNVVSSPGGVSLKTAISLYASTGIFQNATIENCSTTGSNNNGAAVCLSNGSELSIYGGTYRNNTAESYGGFLAANGEGDTVHIYGGTFSGNTAKSGGCIYNYFGNVYIEQGSFEGNTSTDSDGSGAISTLNTDKKGCLVLSGDIQFAGGRNPSDTHTDGITLLKNSDKDFSAQIQLTSPLQHPLAIYVKASEEHVLVKGSNSYALSKNDMEKITVEDLNGVTGWYKVLDKENNQLSLSATKPEEFYEIRYDSNGAGGTVSDSRTYKIGDTAQILSGKNLHKEGSTFVRWNTSPDDSGAPYQEGASLEITGDITLYAIFRENPDTEKTFTAAFYSGSPVQKELIPVSITDQVPSAVIKAPKLKEVPGWTPLGWNPNPSEYKSSIPSGSELTLTENTSYYGIYQTNITLSYDMEDEENIPEPETQVCYINVHQETTYDGPEFTLAPAPASAPEGYVFKGWNTKADGSGITYPADSLQTLIQNTILYPDWADETAPVLGAASFSSGHKNFLDWIIRKRGLVITVPITEEGSGVKEAAYTLTWEDGTQEKGTAEVSKVHTQTEQALAYGSSASVIRALQTEADTGTYEARIVLNEDFKGKASLTCTDNAGNTSPQKVLTAAGGGIIIEDNAPKISFFNTKDHPYGEDAEIDILVEDGKEGRVTGGIAGISYQIDQEEKVVLPESDFNEAMVESYDFQVTISDSGSHTIQVTAIDNAGNESKKQATVKITDQQDPEEPESPENPADTEDPADEKDSDPPISQPSGNSGGTGSSTNTKLPRGSEPRTGDFTHVKMYATFSMIAGFGYLLLYFAGEHGITEQEKDDILLRLVTWGKQGRRLQRIFALAAIFLFLAYYHSIGKSVTVEWREVYVKKNK
ncbi:MAG: hypothetical protein HFH41_07740 [Lachnospiraceae bacterium]|nr:hypothetical protein [Lachnospiraceae bacterium]